MSFQSSSSNSNNENSTHLKDASTGCKNENNPPLIYDIHLLDREPPLKYQNRNLSASQPLLNTKKHEQHHGISLENMSNASDTSDTVLSGDVYNGGVGGGIKNNLNRMIMVNHPEMIPHEAHLLDNVIGRPISKDEKQDMKERRRRLRRNSYNQFIDMHIQRSSSKSP